jgi:hypothetical protein
MKVRLTKYADWQTNILALNAALVEQSAAAAMKMRDQANALTAAVEIFKTHV